jgi:methionyl-tRNA formyltransferase
MLLFGDSSLSSHPRPRVVLLTSDSAYSRLFAKSFLNFGRVDVVGVFFSSAYLYRARGRLINLLYFAKKVGLGYSLYQAYIAWIFPLFLGLTGKIWQALSVPTLKSNNVNSLESIEWFKKLEADFLLSFHFNQKILEPTAAISKIATVNFHPSLLPQWRGVDPVLFALQNLNSSSNPSMGFSIHLVTDQIDTGDLLLQNELQDPSATGLIKINSSLFTQGGSMAAHVITHFEDFYGSRIPQSSLGVGCYDGWDAVGKLGFSGLKKALCAKPRTAS